MGESMTDLFDRATEREEMDRDLALQVRKPEGPRATGFCLECGEPVEECRRWCGPACRDSWQRRRRPR